MKLCSECIHIEGKYCPIKKYFVSLNAAFCPHYKKSSESKRQEVAEWMNTQGYEFDFKDGLWMEEYDFQEHKTKEVIDLIIDFFEYKSKT